MGGGLTKPTGPVAAEEPNLEPTRVEGEVEEPSAFRSGLGEKKTRSTRGKNFKLKSHKFTEIRLQR
jgi:hypothetical protein